MGLCSSTYLCGYLYILEKVYHKQSISSSPKARNLSEYEYSLIHPARKIIVVSKASIQRQANLAERKQKEANEMYCPSSSPP